MDVQYKFIVLPVKNLSLPLQSLEYLSFKKYSSCQSHDNKQKCSLNEIFYFLVPEWSPIAQYKGTGFLNISLKQNQIV